MKWIAVAVFVVFMLPLLVLCYTTVVLGGGYTDRQWEVAGGMAVLGGCLEIAVILAWNIIDINKKFK